MKTFIIIFIIIILAGFGFYLWARHSAPATIPTDNTNMTSSTTAQTEQNSQSVIGHSVYGKDILAYHYGTGSTELLFVGGIHGGYEWNTVLVAAQLMDYLKANPSAVPSNMKVTVIPVLNSDGLNKVAGTSTVNFTQAGISTSQAVQVSGRFNGDNVDLNRNFDCDWQSSAKWQTTTVSGGSAAFSEPEAKAMRDYINQNHPKAVVVWYSSAGGVFASNCHGGVLPETTTLTDIFASASGYPAHDSFDFYATTGDMTNWLAKINVPSISVLLTNHTDTEFTKNLAGIQAILQHYAASSISSTTPAQ